MKKEQTSIEALIKQTLERKHEGGLRGKYEIGSCGMFFHNLTIK